MWTLAALIAAGLGGTCPPMGASPAPVGRPVFQSIGLGENVIDGPVWAVTSSPQGDLIVGSNRLWIRSGSRWAQIEIRDAYAFRALAPDSTGQRIWLGAINALGYLEATVDGSWAYHSLLERWQSGDPAILGDIWDVVATSQGAIWLTSDRVIRWDGERFESWQRQGSSRLVGAPAGESLWFYDEPRGLLQIGATGAPAVIASAATLPSAPLTWLLPPSSTETTGILGFTDGVYRREADGQLKPLSALSRALNDTLPSRATRLPDGRIAVATFGSGVILADAEGHTLEKIDRAHGLKNNTVYTIASREDQLWVGYQDGLVRIDGVGHSHVVDRESGLRDGVPRGVRFTPEGQWLITSEDVLFRPAKADRFSTALANESLLWSAAQTSSALWVGGFGGVWRSQDTTMQKVYETSTDVLLVSPSRTLAEGILFFEGYRLKSLERSPYGGWAAHDLRVQVEDTPISLKESSDGSVWITTMTGAILRCTWRSNGKEHDGLLVRDRLTGPPALPEGSGRARLVELGDHIFAFTDAGILRWQAAQRRFIVDPLFAAYQGIAATPGLPEQGAYWLVEPHALAGHGPGALLRVATTGDAVTIEPIHGHGINTIGTPTALDQGETSLWISGTEGVLKLDASELFVAPLPPALRLTTHATGLPMELPATPAARLPATTRTLSFIFPPLASDHETVYVQTRLLGADQTWSPPTTETHLDYAALAPGAYRFEARSIDPFGRTGPVAHFDFSLAPPWYRTLPAIVVYAIVGLILVLLGARLRLRRLQQQNEQLNHLVAIRTRELALSNTAKSDFLENISHEIRNPLNGLSGLLALLKEDNLGPRERELTRSLRIVANNLLRVFGDVLSFSRLEYGYVTFDPQPFLLRPILDEVVDFFSIQTRQPAVAITLVWPADLTDGFVGDHAKLRTIVENFTANALKYAPGSPIEIRVSATPHSDEVTVAVADQGNGIPPEERALIFEKFVRGAETKRNRVAGTGLGLATCRALARLMQGEVNLSDVAPRGSTFCLTLPLPRTKLAVPKPDPFPLDAMAVESMSALIVEDETYNQIVLEGVAKQLGYDVDVAPTAQHAMNLLAAKPYQVIFLDWELPDAKGIEVARTVRRTEGATHAIIIAATAHDSDEIRAQCREAGMDEFLLKPYDTETVARLIAHARASRRGKSEEKPRPPTSSPLEPFNSKAFSIYSHAKRQDEPAAILQFIESLDRELMLLQAAMAAAEFETAKGHAHHLRALSGLIGARALNGAARRFEELGVSPTASEARESAWREVDGAAQLLKSQLEETRHGFGTELSSAGSGHNASR